MKLLCKFNLGHKFKVKTDSKGCWGECFKCGKRTGYTKREDIRRAIAKEDRIVDFILKLMDSR